MNKLKLYNRISANIFLLLMDRNRMDFSSSVESDWPAFPHVVIFPPVSIKDV